MESTKLNECLIDKDGYSFISTLSTLTKTLVKTQYNDRACTSKTGTFEILGIDLSECQNKLAYVLSPALFKPISSTAMLKLRYFG